MWRSEDASIYTYMLDRIMYNVQARMLVQFIQQWHSFHKVGQPDQELKLCRSAIFVLFIKITVSGVAGRNRNTFQTRVVKSSVKLFSNVFINYSGPLL